MYFGHSKWFSTQALRKVMRNPIFGFSMQNASATI